MCSYTSCSHLLIWNKLLSSCVKVDDSKRLATRVQVVLTRLIYAVPNKLVRACFHQLVNNLVRAEDIRFVGTTCCITLQVFWLHKPCYKMITTCSSPDLSTTGNKQYEVQEWHLVDKLSCKTRVYDESYRVGIETCKACCQQGQLLTSLEQVRRYNL
jgi:hypothetical protein